MKKYNWLIDLIAQMIFSVSFTILSLGGVLTVLNAIQIWNRQNKSRRVSAGFCLDQRSLQDQNVFLLRRHKQTLNELGETFPNFSFHPFLAPVAWKIAQTSYLPVTLSHEPCVKLTVDKKICDLYINDNHSHFQAKRKPLCNSPFQHCSCMRSSSLKIR